MQDIDEEEAVRKEEERLKRLQAKKNQQYANAVFGSGLSGARAGQAPASKPVYGAAAAPAAAPVKQPTSPRQVVHHPPVQTHQPPVNKPVYVPPPPEPVQEVNHLPTSILGINEEEIMRREEERMSKRFGGGGGSASPLANWNPAPRVPPPGQPAKVESKPAYTAPPAQHAPAQHHTPAPAPAAPKPVEPTPYNAPVQTYQAQSEPAPVHRQKQEWELPPPQPVYGTKFESMLLAELVSIRTNPHSLIPQLEERKKHFHGYEYKNIYTQVTLPTKEGVQGVENAISYLKQFPMVGNFPRLRLEDGLSQSARDFCATQKGTDKTQETDDEAQARLTRYGRFHGSVAQNVAFTNVSPEELVIDWIIDDGNHARSHREAIFNHANNVVGIASGPCPVGRIVTVLFAHDYTPAGAAPPAHSHQAAPAAYQAAPAAQSYQAAPVAHQAPKPVSSAPIVQKYPEFQIGQLVFSPDNKYNLLAISNLGCNLQDLYVGTRSNGNSLEFSRKSPTGTDTRVFGLPYQVNASTTAATYSPSTNGGELTIRLGKIIPFSTSAGEHPICSYNVPADPSSPHPRVSVKVVQDNNEYYEFLPGPASPHETLVEAVLSGTNLLFKSTYDATEGGSVVTKKVTQTIALPTVPGSDQIETHPVPGGTAVRIYHKPRGNVTQQNVPDTDIAVVLA